MSPNKCDDVTIFCPDMRQNDVIEVYVSWINFNSHNEKKKTQKVMEIVALTNNMSRPGQSQNVNMLRQEARAKKPHRTQGILSSTVSSNHVKSSWLLRPCPALALLLVYWSRRVSRQRHRAIGLASRHLQNLKPTMKNLHRSFCFSFSSCQVGSLVKKAMVQCQP